MSRTAQSIYYFSFYLLATGLLIFLAPNFVITLLGFEPTNDIWIHLVGSLTFILGVFFCYTARKDIQGFFYISMFGRGIFTASILCLIFFYGAPVKLVLFGAVDVIGLLWTLLTYRKAKPTSL